MADPRHQRILNILTEINPLNEDNRRNFSQGFKDDYSIGREDMQQAFYRRRHLEGEGKEAPRIKSLSGTHPGLTRLQEMTGKISPEKKQALQEADLQLRTDKPLAHQGGQLLGTLAADLTQDSTRSVYWLLNALQAAGDVVNESLLANKVVGTPELWQKTPVTRPVMKGDKQVGERVLNKRMSSDMDYALDNGLLKHIDGEDRPVPRRGYAWQGDDLVKRNYEPGMLAALAIPSGLAINNAIGLMTPFGGPEGYKANNPSPEDPTKTNNVVAEVAQKYILGKTGGLLPYSEFSKVRPDVSRAEYGMYQADRYDNSEDWNPLDGDVAVLGGAFKANTEGIHGPEASILGRSLPVTTGIIPTASAIAGTLIGARVGHHRYGKGASGGLAGGMTGAMAGIAVGNIIEGERRRRNGIDNGELPLS